MKKKILFITTDLEAGGAEKVLVDILNLLDYNLYDVELLLVFYRGVYISDIPPNVRIKSLYNKNKYTFCQIVSYMLCRKVFHFNESLVYKIYLLLFRKNDIVISFLEGNRNLLLHSIIFDKKKTNISWIHCDPLMSDYISKSFMSEEKMLDTYNKMDSIICVSEQAKKNLLTLFDIPESKVKVILNPIDIHKVKTICTEYAIEKKRFTIGFIGRLSKRADRLIRVAALFKKDGYELDFWFVGDGDIDALENMVRELGVEDNCHFLGFQNPPYPYMKAIDIYVSTSDSEGFSLTICEAACLGKALVATSTAGIISILEDNKYGLLTDFDDLSIYKTLRSLVDDPALLHYYQGQALKLSEKLGIDKTMRQIYTLLNTKEPR